MPNIQAPRGTRDILPADQPLWQFVQAEAKRVAEQLGFQPITTPTYEDLALFSRSIGGGTDVIDKELFLVRGVRSEGEDSYALRPEGTAGIVRAFIQHGMHTWPQPVKLYSEVRNFRYDRPQRGRYREHVQFDIEYFGAPSPFADAWIIYATWIFLNRVGLQGLELQLNTLGTAEERASYVAALKDYLIPLKDQLSEDSQHRLEVNPLRIIDSKNENDQRLTEGAPTFSSFLTEESNTHITEVEAYLRTWNIPFVRNPRLVRGLDYYCHTAFEWTVTGNDRQQASLGGGGRYDGLIENLGGPKVGAVGAGIGLDRVVEALTDQGYVSAQASTPQIFIVSSVRDYALTQIAGLVENGWRIDAALDKEGFSNQMKMADRSGAKVALLLGEDEMNNQTVTIKNMESGEQTTIPQGELQSFLAADF